MRELLSVSTDGDIDRQLSGTVRNPVVYDKITGILCESNIMRQKNQVLKAKNSEKKVFADFSCIVSLVTSILIIF